MRKLLLAALLVLVAHGTSFAKVTSLEGANFGQNWYGPQRTPEGIKGHIVLWEDWGYN